MEIRSFKHKGLRRLYENDDIKGLDAAMVDKLRKLFMAMDAAQQVAQLGKFPGWRLHALRGDLKGYWSLTVTGNWRLVFRYDEATAAACDVDLVDYH